MTLKVSQRSVTRAVLSAALCLATLLAPAAAADAPAIHTSLDQGFRLLYDLDFDQAHQVFLSWQHDHPQDPVGPTAEAAGDTFLGVFTGWACVRALCLGEDRARAGQKLAAACPHDAVTHRLERHLSALKDSATCRRSPATTPKAPPAGRRIPASPPELERRGIRFNIAAAERRYR